MAVNSEPLKTKRTFLHLLEGKLSAACPRPCGLPGAGRDELKSAVPPFRSVSRYPL
ncbi:Hypothetical predicted protein [Podarcis lilfordi]|uniref:Uncharacterized protein n=1 Tax=Podarcis lilfordi TaxID=74358 RepID=A0AA35P7G3_9SAUR|nr:Hypothetical predicted protein [Podarcis lilfordi]